MLPSEITNEMLLKRIDSLEGRIYKYRSRTKKLNRRFNRLRSLFNNVQHYWKVRAKERGVILRKLRRARAMLPKLEKYEKRFRSLACIHKGKKFGARTEKKHVLYLTRNEWQRVKKRLLYGLKKRVPYKSYGKCKLMYFNPADRELLKRLIKGVRQRKYVMASRGQKVMMLSPRSYTKLQNFLHRKLKGGDCDDR